MTEILWFAETIQFIYVPLHQKELCYFRCSDGEKIEWENKSNGKMYKPGPYTAFMSTSMVSEVSQITRKPIFRSLWPGKTQTHLLRSATETN